MTKHDAIEEAKKRLVETGIAQFVDTRGNGGTFEVHAANVPLPPGRWRTVEAISHKTIHAYK